MSEASRVEMTAAKENETELVKLDACTYLSTVKCSPKPKVITCVRKINALMLVSKSLQAVKD
jgi:hypothetical protein